MENYNKLKKRYEEFYNSGLNRLEAFLKSLEEFDIKSFSIEELKMVARDLSLVVSDSLKKVKGEKRKYYALMSFYSFCLAFHAVLALIGGAAIGTPVVGASLFMIFTHALPKKAKIKDMELKTNKANSLSSEYERLAMHRERKKQAITIEPTKNSVGKGKSMNELYDFIVRSFSKLPNDMARGYWTKLQSIFIIYGGDLEKNKEMIVDNLGSLADQVVESLNMIDGLNDKSNREENLGSSVNL